LGIRTSAIEVLSFSDTASELGYFIDFGSSISGVPYFE
jgi:hypothetical protein